jgi:hypothetical protein
MTIDPFIVGELKADGGKGEASLTRWQKAQMAFGGTAPQAECAPRMWLETGHFGSDEPPRVVVDGSGMIDAMEDFAPVPAPREAQPNWKALHAAADAVAASDDIWAGFSTQDAKVCVDAYLAAPTPERADADTAGASERDALKQKGLDDHLRRLQQDGMKSEERADAGKGAALTDERIIEIFQDHYTEEPGDAEPGHILPFARAILAANKEPK